MQQTQALAEMIEYLAGALEDQQIDPVLITGDMLRALVKVTRGLPDGVSIGEVWNQTHNVIASAWRHHAPV